MVFVAGIEVERVRRLIDGLRRDRRTHPQQGRREYSQLVRNVVAACEALIESESAVAATLAQRAVDLVTAALMNMDDSSGVLGEDLRVLMTVHARACAVAPPDPKRLAAWLLKLRLDGPGWPDFELRDYAAALGETGHAELAHRVEDRARTAEPDLLGRTPFGIRLLREQLAEISGDVDHYVDHYVAVLAEDLYAASQYGKIVGVLRDAGRAADAESWAQRGLQIDNPVDKDKLRDTYVDLLLERGATDEAFAMRWQLFDRDPNQVNYNDLRRTAERTGHWPGLRDKAIGRLRAAAIAQQAFVDHLIGVLVDDGELSEAWQAALDHADDVSEARLHMLVDLRQPAHPQDVIEPWQRLIERRLDVSTDKYRYSKVIKMLQRLRDAYQASGDAVGFETYLGRLRDRHKRKSSFITKLDHANL
jgi:tetratricopeptide (TPR) repeat protein